MTFEDCVLECCKTPELIKEYDRLQGSNLAKVLIPQPLILFVIFYKHKDP